MALIKKTYPGKNAAEIYEKVHQVMAGIAHKMSLDYQTDAGAKTGKVSKLGVTGAYVVKDGEVVVDLSFPFIMPGSVKKKVQADVERKLDGLFA
jgi:hypothetical protein